MKKIEDYRAHSHGKIGIRCETQEEWDEIIKLMPDESFKSSYFLGCQKEGKTCNTIFIYNVGTIGWGENYVDGSHTIYPASDFLEEKEYSPLIFN